MSKINNYSIIPEEILVFTEGKKYDVFISPNSLYQYALKACYFFSEPYVLLMNKSITF